MDKCPYCGSDRGLFRTYTGTQYYGWDGEPAGYDDQVFDNQRVYARCVRCERRISLERVKKEFLEERK